MGKPELDAVSVASKTFENDNRSNFVSKDDSETQLVTSFSLGLRKTSEQFPVALRSGNLDRPNAVSLLEFGMMSPVLGTHRECSGTSSLEYAVELGNRAESPEN